MAPLVLHESGIANRQTIICGLCSDTSKRPVLQFSESNQALFNHGMSIEYDGRLSGSMNKLYINDIAGQPITCFKSNGDVGIGNTDPSSKLDVSGDVEVGSSNAFYLHPNHASICRWGLRGCVKRN